MTREQIRLEILKLVYVHGRTSNEEILGKAAAFEKYVCGNEIDETAREIATGAEASKGVQDSEASASTDKRQSQKKSGNLKSLL